MKKLLSLLLTALLLLGLIGCKQQELPLEICPPVMETMGVPDTTAPPETTAPKLAPTEITNSSEYSEETDPTRSSVATEGTEPTQPASEPAESITTQPAETIPPETEPPETNPTDPPVTKPTETVPPETEPPETEPEEILPPATEPPTTEPPATQPTEPTEPVGCRHEWVCIRHDEVGHWRAGIACDCGWTVYGEPEELVALWNAHSASYPAVESLFNHGGYGSVDAWIVDQPAYDEWVCRHCGEQKP